MIMKKYNTKDFYFSALLLVNNFELVNSYKKPEGVYFTFLVDNEELFKKLIIDFQTYCAYVNMKKFVNATTRLRKELDKHKY